MEAGIPADRRGMVIVVDSSFISRVVALLLGGAGEGSAPTLVADGPPRGWSGVARLLTVVGDQFAGDLEAQAALTAVEVSTPDRITDLADAVRRHAEIDPAFLAKVRLLVIDAYADPTTAAALPDPSPRL
ncbi:hypothetical protein AB0M20_01160 [Actinoplanes sp. NPDC051633]|uniref:hypothetical protein n=1 Tax=Actinoplanes sp. NPDC051633 TaxID=3155670 RepID=UPI00343F54D3